MGLGHLDPQCGREDLVPGGLERRIRRIRPRARRHEALAEATRALGLGGLEPARDLPDLLVLEQAPHQLGARVLFLLALVAWKEHLRLDADQRRGHLEELARAFELVGSDPLDRGQELLGNPGDGDVEDVHVLLPDQVQEEVERTLEAVQLHHQEILACEERAVRVVQIHKRTNQSAAPMSTYTGRRRIRRALGKTNTSPMIAMNPQRPNSRYVSAARGGNSR